MDGTFRKRLKKLRIDSGKTQDEMAKLLNIKRTTYGEYERGKIIPAINKIEKLASIFNVTPQFLIGWDAGKTNGKLPFETINKMAKYFNVDTEILGGIDFYKSAEEKTELEAAVNLIIQAKKWNEAIGSVHFTDDEMEELINYAKYIISKRNR